VPAVRVASTIAAASSTRHDFVTVSVPWWAWVATGAAVMVLLAVDILVLHREAKVPTPRRAAVETASWLAIGVSFGVIVLAAFGGAAAGEYYSGYLIELSLSIDNVFVWALIMTFFAVPRAFQHRVLFWGIFGAVLLRSAFVFAGVALVERFEWILIGFGLFLLYTAWKLLRSSGDDEIDPDANPFLRLVRKVVPSTTSYDGQHLWTKVNGRRLATPLFAVLVMVETTDVLFAVDSVPAVLGVSREQFIVLTSNAFAILGLRALYFLLADLHDRFEYLQHGLAVILAFVGLKMVLARWVHVSTAASLLVILVVLATAVVGSVQVDRRRSRTG
jgi:tellurite resistance protein TerC